MDQRSNWKFPLRTVQGPGHMSDAGAGAWCPLDPRTSEIVATVRLDIAVVLENDGVPPPVMFSNRALLDDWAAEKGLQRRAISGVREGSAVEVAGFYRGRTAKFGYSQVWTRATYSRYARSLQAVALRGYNMERAALAGHADHVINRARLKLHPDAWTVIFPVYHSANCPFGRIERSLPSVPAGVDRMDLPPLVALKLFCGTLPRTPIELSWAMRDIRGHFDQASAIVQTYCDAIEAQSVFYMQRSQSAPTPERTEGF
jgi:hypothetical protein